MELFIFIYRQFIKFMDTLGRGFSTKIDNNLILKIASNTSEIRKIASFNVKIHGEPISDFIISLFTEDPFREESFWLYLEDSRTGEILSSLALLTNYWSFGGINIKIAEMGFVGTLEEHRSKGLYRILNTFYEKLVSQEGLFVSILRGIPYFYSNYGYGFSLPTDTGYCLNVKNFKAQESGGEHSIRKAVKSDFNMIGKLYNEIFDSMFISTTFNHESFHYRFNSKNNSDNFGTTYVVQKNQDMIGFFTLAEVHHTDNQAIFLISNMEAVAVKEV
ncbi:MAG: GNAT family N-acetyltransferase, partial [Candidatus Heimdallarchaeota archaeon]